MRRKRKKARLCLLWQRFGPYHHARFRAARTLFDAVGVEVSPVDSTYAWDAVAGEAGAEMATLFPGRASRGISLDEVRRRVDAVLTGIGPDAVAIPGWSDRAALAALEWCLQRGVPAVLMSPSQRDDAPRVWHKEWVKRRVVGLYSAALVGGAPQKRYLLELGFAGDRVFAGYNVVDNVHFASGAREARRAGPALRRALGLARDFFLVSTRFVPKKNLVRFLEAYAIYTKRAGGRPWSLVLLGDGSGRAELENRVKELRLMNFVGMPGFKQYNALPAYYGLARALALPSTSEQWGLVVNEAMAAGLPVLVSRGCGCREDLVRDGENGFLLDPWNTGQMADVLSRTAGAGASLVRMGARSAGIIGRLGPRAFARGLAGAVDAARVAEPRFADRLLLDAVMRQDRKAYQDQ